MTPLILYLLKANLALLLFYLAYRYGLRKLTFYTLNRVFLLFAIGFASVCPLIDVGAFIRAYDVAGSEMIHYLPDLNSLADTDPLEIWNVLEVVFWSGVVIMAARFLVQCASLLHIHLGSVKEETEQQTIRSVSKKINPFSFFRNIYMNPQLHSRDERRSIIEHERVHIQEWHTADVLAGELNRIFYWFNPGAWLIMTAIRENLEFITDRKVLREGVDIKTYQYTLVKAGSIPHASALANNFNFSHLKIRITMMDKKPSSELHLVKYLVLVPVVAALILAFNVTRAAFTPPVIVKFTAPLIVANDTLPANVSHVSQPFQLDFLCPLPRTPDWETNKKLYKDNFTGYAKTMAAISHIDADDPVVLNGKLTNGRNALNVARKEGIGFAAKLENELAQYYVRGENLLYWLETKTAGKAPNRPDFPPPPEVKEVRFTPPTIVPKKGKEGDTIAPPPPAVREKPDHSASLSSSDTTSQLSEVVAVGYSSINSSGIRLDDPTGLSDDDPGDETTVHDTAAGNLLIVVDGVLLESDELAEISPNNIASISVLKGKGATAIYGNQAKHGVILITTKENAARNEDLTEKVVTGHPFPVSDDILYVLDGKVTTVDKVKGVPRENIQSIDVLKDKHATDKYGKKGENGVIEITTKDK